MSFALLDNASLFVRYLVTVIAMLIAGALSLLVVDVVVAAMFHAIVIAVVVPSVVVIVGILALVTFAVSCSGFSFVC